MGIGYFAQTYVPKGTLYGPWLRHPHQRTSSREKPGQPAEPAAAWSSLCSSGPGNSLAGAASHESRLPRLLAGASVVEARWFGEGGRGEQIGCGEEGGRWRRAR
jgi:hypothetical protein